MTRPELEVADIFRRHGPAWREANRGHVSLDQLKRHVRRSREDMRSSNFSVGLRSGMDSLIEATIDY